MNEFNFLELVVPLLTVLGMFIANAAMIIPLFLWVRSEARTDARHMDEKLESTKELVRAIHEEVKDFHARLIAIEKIDMSKKIESSRHS